MFAKTLRIARSSNKTATSMYVRRSCPQRRAAYIAVDGNAQECIPGPDMCADGFECVRSVNGNGKNICCSKENECGEDEKMINGTCVVQIRIGGRCHKDEECSGGSECKSNMCR
ncbi:hypothetical protein COOONC_24284 [Cooperia oncophora]